MNLLNKLQAESDKMANTKEEIITEIKNDFSKYINTKFENFLERNIGDEAKQKREYKLYYEFWEYTPGCSKTRFYIAGWQWFNKEVPDYSYEQDFYKGFRLKDIHEEVIMQCLNVLKDFLETNGFHYRVSSERNRFKELRGEIVISW